MIRDGIKFISSGDSAIYCSVSDSISSESSKVIIELHRLLIQQRLRGYIESVPSYAGLMIYFDPLVISEEDIQNIVLTNYNKIIDDTSPSKGRLIKVPVCYEKEYGLDLESVALGAGISIEELIKLHTLPEYLIYMLGFTPGFPYLGGLDSRIHTPRKSDPRIKIKAGSVGIAGEQTGIYPIESPGGWQIIGRTPLSLFNHKLKNPFLFKAGDIVRFFSISLTEFFKIGEMVRTGDYIPDIKPDYERN